MTQTFTLPMDLPHFEAAVRDANAGSAEARFVAAIALGRIRGKQQEQALSTLVRLAQDPLEEIRAQALEGIAEQVRGGAEISGKLIDQALTDPSPRVRAAAIETTASPSDGRTDLSLIPMLADSDPAVRATACRVLGDSENSRCIDAIARLLEDRVPFVAHEAAMALAELGDPRGESILIELLSSRSQSATEAAYALGRIGSATACPHLRAIASKTFVNAELKAMAAAALVKSGADDGRHVLRQLLASRRHHTKLMTLTALARLPIENIFHDVALLMESSKPDVISAAIETLYFLAEFDKQEVIGVLETKRALLDDDLLAELDETLSRLIAPPSMRDNST